MQSFEKQVPEDKLIIGKELIKMIHCYGDTDVICLLTTKALHIVFCVQRLLRSRISFIEWLSSQLQC